MQEHTRWPGIGLATFALIIISGVLVSGSQQDCTYLQNPDEFKVNPNKRHTDLSAMTARVSMFMYEMSSPATTLDATTVQRKNFIDNAIFDRMAQAGIQSAPLASDAEYMRRVMLDLTGRIPSPSDVTTFVNDPNPAKRDALVDSLIGTPEFIDKWTMFFGDLYKNNARSTNVTRYTQGRDAFYEYIKQAITENRPYDQMAREIIAATGDSFAKGEANWVVGGTIAMGPAQDTYDGQAVATASMFLGINSVDCLLCHNGSHHLDQVNLWGSQQLRMNMWGLSAFFARTQMQRQVVSQTPQLAKFIVTDANAGEYRLNTTTGNRVARQPTNGVGFIAPKYPFMATSSVNPGESRRQALARLVTADPQFARAIVNYVWEKFMVEAFVTPSNSFDPARLDPSVTLPAQWTLQPTNAALLNQLATWFENNRYDLRALMAMIAKSNAYQLSATYPGTWNVAYVPYYARRYVRRLDAEEIHDAIQKATGVLNTYTLDYLPSVQWAMQFPDPSEPAHNGAVGQFLNSFGRGDRDLNPRRTDGSGLQALNMMNNNFIMSRIHQSNQGSRVASILAQTSDPSAIIRTLFQNTLSRNPTADETAQLMPVFQQQGTRTGAETVQWLLLNKLDFLFNY